MHSQIHREVVKSLGAKSKEKIGNQNTGMGSHALLQGFYHTTAIIIHVSPPS